ncbi:MAG: tail fiber domain-containing protein, partial [Bacteroidota bacterium]
YGLYNDLDNTYTGTGTTYGIFSDVYRSNSGGNTYGGYFSGRNFITGSGNQYGVYGYAYRSSSSPSSISYGVYGLASGSAPTEWGGYFIGSVYTTGSFQMSDRKFKKDVKPYGGALSTLMQLGTYTYEYDTDTYFHMNLPEGPQIGLLAQDVERLYPHLTKATTQDPLLMPQEDAEDWVGAGKYVPLEDGMAHVGPKVDFTSVNYAGFVPVLVQSIKEQQEVIEDLNEENDALKNRLDRLEQRLQQLENE